MRFRSAWELEHGPAVLLGQPAAGTDRDEGLPAAIGGQHGRKTELG